VLTVIDQQAAQILCKRRPTSKRLKMLLSNIEMLSQVAIVIQEVKCIIFPRCSKWTVEASHCHCHRNQKHWSFEGPEPKQRHRDQLAEIHRPSQPTNPVKGSAELGSPCSLTHQAWVQTNDMRSSLKPFKEYLYIPVDPRKKNQPKSKAEHHPTDSFWTMNLKPPSYAQKRTW
jgi:hypothetical protein